MKNSLLKRAIAAAATVPLALSQCLTYSFAVTEDETAAPTAIADDAASVSSITLEKLLYIAPTETKSKWNNLVTSAIKTAIDSGNVAGSIEVDSIFNTVASKAGTYSELVAAVLGQVTGVDYEIASNGDITITAEIDNVSEALSKDFNKSLGNAVKKLADECNVPELNDIDFTTVNVSGTIKVVIAASVLDAGTEIPVTFEFAPSEGGSLGTVAAIEWAKSKVEEYREVAYDKIDSLAAQGISINAADAKAEIDKSFDSYINQLNRAENGVKKAVVKNAVSKEYGSVENVIAAANRKLAKKNIKRTIPATGAAIASSEVVKSVYDVAIAEINKAAAPSAVNIELAEIGAFIDSLTSVNAGVASGVYTLSGQFDDAEADAVAAYYNSNDELGAYVSSYKIITGTVDLSGANDSAASVDVEIERVVVTEPKTTTTTTTTTSDTSQTNNSGSTSTKPNTGNNDTPFSSNMITLTMPDGTKFDRISKDDFIKLSYDEKMAYISSFTPDQQQVIIDNLSPEERRSILKQLPVDQKVDVVNGLSDAMKTMGLNISIEEVSDDSLELSMRNESGELVSVSNAVTLVEETGYDRRKIFAVAGALFSVSAIGLYILIHQTFNRKEIGEENE